MRARLRMWWHTMTSMPCERCGAPVPVRSYRQTGRARKDTWWAGPVVELECPVCGHTFWAKR